MASSISRLAHRSKMIRHLVTQPRLDAFADGELAEARALAILFHLDECVDCVTELDQVLWAKSVLAQYRGRVPGVESAAAVARLAAWAEREVPPVSGPSIP